ncbi:MAG: hypothetical protein J2P22_11760 [Nocardioides sp.]|nr:hypothetical protein [Nocardioides sp.]
MPRPFILLDVDGCLAPYPIGYVPDGFEPVFLSESVPPVLLAQRHRAALGRLAERADLVWCTAWEHEANHYIGPWLGLPPLPVIAFDDMRYQAGDRGCWKTRTVEAWLAEHNRADRPWVWLDDEITPADEERLAGHPAPHLLVGTDPFVGLTDLDVRRVEDWIGSL